MDRRASAAPTWRRDGRRVRPQALSVGWLLITAWATRLPGYLALVTGLHVARRLLERRKVRRGLDATTGAVLLGFSARLATEHV